MKHWMRIVVPGLIALTVSSIAAWGQVPPAVAQPVSTPPPGALVRMDMHTTVGVELDEIPAGPQREAAADWALSRGEGFWEKRATEQVNLTYYRLVFRSFYYSPPPARGDLPLPPHAAWKFEILSAPTRTPIGGHDYVAVPYPFWTYIVTEGPPSHSGAGPADQNRCFACVKRVRH